MLSAVVAVAVLGLAAVGAGAAATPSDPTPGAPGELEVQLLGDDGMVSSYQVDTEVGSINVTDGNGNWENTTLPTANETAQAIEWAIDDSTATNDTVLIGPGTYNGTVVVTAGDRTIRGYDGADATTLTKHASDDEVGFDVSAPNVTIADLTVRGFDAAQNSGIYLRSGASNATVESTVLDTSSRGVRVESDDNTIVGNTVVDATYGINVRMSSGNRIADNSIARANNGVAVSAGATDNLVENNTVTGDPSSNPRRGLYVHGSTGNRLANNSVREFEGTGITIENTAQIASDNVLVDNVVVNASDTGVRLLAPANELRNTTVSGSGAYGVELRGADGSLLQTVDASDNADGGIHVNDSDDVELRDLVVSGNGDAGDEYGVHVSNGSDRALLVDGTLEANSGGGVLATHSAAPTVRNSTIAGRSPVRIEGPASGASVTGNAVTPSSESDGVRVEAANSSVRNNSVVGGGRGLWIEAANVTVADNEVRDSVEGIFLTGSNHTLVRNVATSADLGIYFETVTDATAADNDASGNGQGVILIDSRNNTFTGTVVSDNVEYGLRLPLGPSSSHDNVFTDVTARNNGEAAYHATDVTGGTNVLSGLNLGASTAADTTVDVEATNVSIRAVGSSPGAPSGLESVGRLVNVTTTSQSAPLDLTTYYDAADVDGLDESTLGLWRHAGGSWAEVGGASVDTDADEVSATSGSGAVFGLYAEESSSSSGGLPSRSPRDDGSDDDGSDDDGPIELSFHDVAVSDDRVAPGETVTVTVTVRNEDDRSGTRDLSLADGQTVLDELSVSLDADEERRIEFAGEIDATGTYEFGVDGEHLATIRVVESESDDAADAADGATDGEGGDETDDATDDAADDDAEDEATATPAGSSGGFPWLLLVLALLAVAGAVGYYYRDEVRERLADGREHAAVLRERYRSR